MGEQQQHDVRLRGGYEINTFEQNFGVLAKALKTFGWMLILAATILGCGIVIAAHILAGGLS